MIENKKKLIHVCGDGERRVMEFFDGDYICHHCSVKTQLAIAEIQCLLGEIGLSDDENTEEYH